MHCILSEKTVFLQLYMHSQPLTPITSVKAVKEIG